ncbi:MAG: hypothetical protein M3123_06605, partial [Actinomycetota bacterium]|nr:hypothetical protein [Actinomycetota bacterium]
GGSPAPKSGARHRRENELAARRAPKRDRVSLRPVRRKRKGRIFETLDYLDEFGDPRYILKELALRPVDQFDHERDRIDHPDRIDDIRSSGLRERLLVHVAGETGTRRPAARSLDDLAAAHSGLHARDLNAAQRGSGEA